MAKYEKDKFKKQRADDWVALMTPIIKAYATDIGSESANLRFKCMVDTVL